MIELQQIKAGYAGWPAEISEEEMHNELKETKFVIQPFRAPQGLGLSISCACGCEHGATYHLVRKTIYDAGNGHGQWHVYVSIKPMVEMVTKTVKVWVLAKVDSPPMEDYAVLAERMRGMVPGAMTLTANPCDCKPFKRVIWDMIQHLNDKHHPKHSPSLDMWSRERIADWLETLDADLVLDPGRTRPRPEPTRPLDKYSYFNIGKKYGEEITAQQMHALHEAMQKSVSAIEEAFQQLNLTTQQIQVAMMSLPPVVMAEQKEDS